MRTRAMARFPDGEAFGYVSEMEDDRIVIDFDAGETREFERGEEGASWWDVNDSQTPVQIFVGEEIHLQRGIPFEEIRQDEFFIYEEDFAGGFVGPFKTREDAEKFMTAGAILGGSAFREIVSGFIAVRMNPDDRTVLEPMGWLLFLARLRLEGPA